MKRKRVVHNIYLNILPKIVILFFTPLMTMMTSIYKKPKRCKITQKNNTTYSLNVTGTSMIMSLFTKQKTKNKQTNNQKKQENKQPKQQKQYKRRKQKKIGGYSSHGWIGGGWVI